MDQQDDLTTARQKVLDTLDENTFVGPVQPEPDSLATVRNATLKVLGSDKVKKQLFDQRQTELQQPISTTPAGTVTAVAQGTAAGLVKGLFSPVSAFMPDTFNDKLDAWTDDAARKLLGLQAKSQYKSTYQAAPKFSEFLAGAPSLAGEMGGSLPLFAVGYGAAREAFEVPKAATFVSKAGRSVLAATSTGGVFSAAARLDPGESRWAKVATDAAGMGAFEIVGVPAMMKAWKEEAPALVEKIPEALHPQVTAIRAGVPASDGAVEAVLQAAKGDPELMEKPVVLQAAKQKEAKGRINNPTVSIDPVLATEAPNLAARVTVTVDDQPILTKDITRDPSNPQNVVNQANELKQQVQQLVQTGENVRVSSITSGSHEDVQLIANTLQGKTVSPPPRLVKKRKVPGAAPDNSVAVNGPIPSPGTPVSVVEPDKPVLKGTVLDSRVTGLPPEVEPLPVQTTDITTSPTRLDEIQAKFGFGKKVEEPAPVVEPPPVVTEPRPSAALSDEARADRYARMKEASANAALPVEMADKTVKMVPLAQLQTPLEVGVRQGMDLQPHLDGSTRHAIIHLDDGSISFEPLGAPQEADSNYFRSALFSSTDPDTQWGRDPRLLIHGSNEVTINPQPIEELRPQIVTLKRAAKTLIDNGVASSTVDKGTGKTLQELANTELPLANLQQLQDDAAERGLKAVPFGTQVTLQSKNGFSRTFGNSLEAHEAVLRMPKAEVGRKIEADLEAAWKVGSERAVDPDVDVNKYLPLQVQERGIAELAQGKRPLVPVYTTDPGALTNTVRQLERSMGVPENTFKIQLLPAMDDGKRKAAVLYNSDLVSTQAALHRNALSYVGVSAREPGDILRQLSTKKQGIYILAGRDADSAALYTHYRENGAKEYWERGRLEADALGTYRRFPAAQKAVVRYSGAGDEFHPMDIADAVQAPAVHFTPDSNAKPRMVEEMAPFEPDLSFGKEPPRWDKKNPPSGEPYDVSGPLTKLTNRIRPMLELSKDLQTRTGVPFYEWYKGIEAARNKVEQITNPILQGVNKLAKTLTVEERKNVQLLFEARAVKFGPEREALEKQLSERVKTAATALEQTYHDFFNAEGYTGEDVHDFFQMFPEMRKRGGDFKASLQGRSGIPKIGNLLSKEMENGTISIDDRELDFQRIANRVIRSATSERYLQPTWDRVAAEVQAWDQAKRIPADYGHIFGRYMSEVLHLPDALQDSLGRMTKQVLDKLGMKVSDLESRDFVSMLSQMNYFTNMAWRPSIILRDLTQVMQTSFPILGGKDTLSGWRYALKWWKDPKLQEDMVGRGIVQPGAIYEPLREVSSLMERGGGPLDKAVNTFFNKGTQWNANAHDFDRVAAYWGQYTRAKRVGQEYLDKKIDWQTFLEKSRLDMRDSANGPFIQKLKGLMQSGQLEQAASLGAEEFAKGTQFVYTRGNAPYVMQSTLGRFMLQYGTWPMWYAENLRNMFARGSVKNRVAALSRWTAVQGSMFATANALFGVDVGRWVFFSPLGYGGSPWAQIGMQAQQTFKNQADTMGGLMGKGSDPVARIAQARLAGSVLKQVTPLPLNSMGDLWKGLQDLQSGSWQDAMRNFLGLPPSKGNILP